jgi:hypothetical protein
MTAGGTEMSAVVLRTVDIRLLDDLFGMGGGYVLDFSDRTFSSFFRELGVDIDDARFSAEGTSKAKRLRYFLKSSDQASRLLVLQSLWEYRESVRRRRAQAETVPGAEDEFWALIERLGGTRPRPKGKPSTTASTPEIDLVRAASLRDRLIEISNLEPQPRGYAFERFLKELFDLSGLAGKSAFSLIGEQIDGSFQLGGETYLLEAKWRGAPTGASDLRAFNAKVEAKAAWSRGLFISHAGFSDEGLIAFGTGKRVVCMDGLDLYDVLDQALSFGDVVSRKVRHAAECGQPFIRVRDLNG